MIKLLLLLLTAGKLGKILVSVGSMLLSLALYAQVFGWPYAAGFVALLFVHEMGHYAAARSRGLPVSAPAFIPFVGAFIVMRDHPRDAETEAYVAFAGPFVGAVAAFACYLWARSADSSLGIAVAYAGFMLNLFNLLPISPLDGGRITAVISPKIWLIGGPLLVALLIWRPSPTLFVVLIAAIPQFLAALRHNPGDPTAAAYYNAPAAVRLEYGVLYLGLTALLGVMTFSTHAMLASLARG